MTMTPTDVTVTLSALDGKAVNVRNYVRQAVKALNGAGAIETDQSKQILAKIFKLYLSAWRTVWESIPRVVSVGAPNATCKLFDLNPGIIKIQSTFDQETKYARSLAARFLKQSKSAKFSAYQKMRLQRVGASLTKKINKTVAEHAIELQKIKDIGPNSLSCVGPKMQGMISDEMETDPLED